MNTAVAARQEDLVHLEKPALQEFRDALGAEQVRVDGLAASHTDPYSFSGEGTIQPAAVVFPASVAEVRQVLRIATRHAVPLWTVSAGRNYGYGGASPRLPGSVVVDLSRMDRVLEIDEECGTALVEPGVTFMDFHAYLRARGSRLWASVPDIGWGSVVGNALERGFGYTPHGDHASMVCGFEVVLATGEVVRTGMGAKAGSPAWTLYKGGYGPSVDGLFFQSNLGIVTKMGVWLMPRPERAAACGIAVGREEDLAPLIDALRPLLLDGTIQSNVVIGNAPVIASMITVRDKVWPDETPITAEGSQRIMSAFGLGFWNARFGLYGADAMVEARLATVRAVVEAIPGARLEARHYAGTVDPGAVHPADRAQLGIPSTALVRMAAWRGGKAPAHTDFSLVCPPTGAAVTEAMRVIRAGVEREGFDYAGGFTLFARHAIALALVSFDRSDATQTERVGRLFPRLVHDCATLGAAPYRSHTVFMDTIAGQYDFGDGALRHLVERLKDTLDPAGVLSPGKQGIWPRRSLHHAGARSHG